MITRTKSLVKVRDGLTPQQKIRVATHQDVPCVVRTHNINTNAQDGPEVRVVAILISRELSVPTQNDRGNGWNPGSGYTLVFLIVPLLVEPDNDRLRCLKQSWYRMVREGSTTSCLRYLYPRTNRYSKVWIVEIVP